MTVGFIYLSVFLEAETLYDVVGKTQEKKEENWLKLYLINIY